MEIGEISALSRLKRLQKNTQVAPSSAIKDSVTLSPEAVEAQKKARFVEMLKEMPEVTSLHSSEYVNKVIAEKVYAALSAFSSVE